MLQDIVASGATRDHADSFHSGRLTRVFGCRARSTSDQLITYVTWVDVEFNTTDYDDGPFFDSEEPAVLTIPKSGHYLVNASIKFDWPSSVGQNRALKLTLFRDGAFPPSTVVGITRSPPELGNNGFISLELTEALDLETDDALTLSAYQDATPYGGGIPIIAVAKSTPRFEVNWVGG